ncbi:MAG TPA: hypothetical protein VFO11_14025, partial [Candidatus Polarisedimenticolaceae bacterium]|nr:hypothetical protein [Candidatus Polarisedimenticolaceae bacterium]
LVGAAYAQTSTTSSTTASTTSSWTTSAVTGTVMSVDPQAKSVMILTDAGANQTFVLSNPMIWMRSAGKDIAISELKVGDRVRIEPTPGAGTEESSITASRLEVLGAGSVQGSTESPSMQTGTPQRTVSTERPVLGERADAGEDTQALPSSAGSTTGRTVSTDRPVFGQKPSPDTATTGSTSTTTSSTTGTSTYGTTSPTTTGTTGTSTYGSSTTTSSSTTTGARSTSTQTRAEELPATASPLPMLGVLGLLALGAGFALRATRKQHS